MFTSGVLVVDDDVDVLDLMKAKLASNGIECDTADSAEDALRKVHKRPYSVVVSDINMPGMNGVELISVIKQYSPLVQIIMLTSDPSISRVIECADRGAVDFFSKGDDWATLIESVRVAQARIDRWIRMMAARTSNKEPDIERTGTTVKAAAVDAIKAEAQHINRARGFTGSIARHRWLLPRPRIEDDAVGGGATARMC